MFLFVPVTERAVLLVRSPCTSADLVDCRGGRALIMRGLALTVMPGASGAARTFFLAITYLYLAFFLAAALFFSCSDLSNNLTGASDIVFLLKY